MMHLQNLIRTCVLKLIDCRHKHGHMNATTRAFYFDFVFQNKSEVKFSLFVNREFINFQYNHEHRM